jgi:hypothetical protein
VITPVVVTKVQSPDTVKPARAPELLYWTWPFVPPAGAVPPLGNVTAPVVEIAMAVLPLTVIVAGIAAAGDTGDKLSVPSDALTPSPQ